MKLSAKALPMALALLVAGVAPEVGAAGAKKGIMTAENELKWEKLGPDSPLQLAPLWGDRTKGAFAMLLKLPAGWQAGMHSHTADYHAVVVQGNWVHTFEGEPPRELPPMSYSLQPAKADHDDYCKGPQDCVLFIQMSGKADIIPAKSKAAPKTANSK